MKKLRITDVSVTNCNYWPQYSPNGGDQWLQSKPWTTSTGQCAWYCTGASAQLSKWLAIMVHFLIVVLFAVALAATGAIRRKCAPGGTVQWLLGEPWTPSIGRCARYHTGASAWPSKRVASEVHLIVVNNFEIVITIAN
jgi:hypothetical protein